MTNNPLDRQIGGDHYQESEIQPLEFIMANDLDPLQAAVIKYVFRHKNKNGVQDIDKAIHYLEIIKQMQYVNPVKRQDDEALYLIRANNLDGDPIAKWWLKPTDGQTADVNEAHRYTLEEANRYKGTESKLYSSDQFKKFEGFGLTTLANMEVDKLYFGI